MRLAKHTDTSLSYKPKLLVPLPISISVWVRRLIRGDNLTVTFNADGSNGETHVTVDGKVGRGSEAIADREFWTEILTPNQTRN